MPYFLVNNPRWADHQLPPELVHKLSLDIGEAIVLTRRWKAERTIGWCMNARRNARDYERLPQHPDAQLI
ncbi:hypothetical protein [Streptomyces sp. NPDC058256]|uniref:hypothetical protein n=1 Tax=Streptomyces sp. NPDC058256 TaxID=3346408 RepID=UPI0036EC3D0D